MEALDARDIAAAVRRPHLACCRMPPIAAAPTVGTEAMISPLYGLRTGTESAPTSTAGLTMVSVTEGLLKNSLRVGGPAVRVVAIVDCDDV
jgi:hypothetical protein